MPDNKREFVPFIDGREASHSVLCRIAFGLVRTDARAACASKFRLSFTFSNFRQPRPRQLEPEFDSAARTAGVYRGQVPFDRLRTQAQEADLLLLLMGFGDECAQTERTSFKTKFLDYLTFQKPIVIWGPEYCSAVRVAREFDAAECYTSPDAAGCIAVLENVAHSPERQKQLVANAAPNVSESIRTEPNSCRITPGVREISPAVTSLKVFENEGQPNSQRSSQVLRKNK